MVRGAQCRTCHSSVASARGVGKWTRIKVTHKTVGPAPTAHVLTLRPLDWYNIATAAIAWSFTVPVQQQWLGMQTNGTSRVYLLWAAPAWQSGHSRPGFGCCESSNTFPHVCALLALPSFYPHSHRAHTAPRLWSATASWPRCNCSDLCIALPPIAYLASRWPVVLDLRSRCVALRHERVACQVRGQMNHA